MSRNLTARDRTVLIKLAHELPKGSEERRSILAGLSAVASQTSPYLYGKGKDEDWIVYFTEYRLQGDTLYVHGYLKGSLAHMSGASHGPLHHDREWAAFDAVFVKVYRKSSV
ncbi:MAG: hypothetical protein LAT68_15425, partial [Cyclobacteriaceae bacterium]|nr:hypothetical protein [Cyclobacteriaceae bacterium]